MTQEKLMVRIAKLVAKERGTRELGNEAEAQAFAAKVQELLTRHKLTMTEVELAAQTDDDPMGTTVADGGGLRGRARRVGWQEGLAGVVARAHFCQILVYPGSSRVAFVGRESDREVAVYMWETLSAFANRASRADCRRFRRECKAEDGDALRARGYKAAWRGAFVAGLGTRYREERARLRRELGHTAGMSLVRLDSARADVEAYAKDAYPRTRAASSVTMGGANRAGRRDGATAAATVPLQAGVGGGKGGVPVLPR